VFWGWGLRDRCGGVHHQDRDNNRRSAPPTGHEQFASVVALRCCVCVCVCVSVPVPVGLQLVKIT